MWKKIMINNEESKYSISTEGLVRNDKSYRIIKTKKDKCGYILVHLSHNGKDKNYSIHRLLACAFIDNVENKATVNHIDGDKENNSLDNLEWATIKENNKHAYNMGLFPLRKTIESRRKKVKCINNDKIYDSVCEASKELGIKQQYISRVCLGYRKQTKGYSFIFV